MTTKLWTELWSGSEKFRFELWFRTELWQPYQEILSSENTPTLCYSIPAFQSFINLWTTLVNENPEWEDIIQPGLFKLEDYVEKLNQAHILAMGEINLIRSNFFNVKIINDINTAIDPGNKLSFYRDDNESDKKFESSRKIFLKAVCLFYL